MGTVHPGHRFDELLQQKPVDQWAIRDTATLGWYDGITCGVCEIIDPEVAFIFTLIAYRDEDATTKCLYTIEEIPLGLVEPLKRLTDRASIKSIEEESAEIDRLLSSRRSTYLLFESPDIVYGKPGDTPFSSWWRNTTPPRT